MQCTSLCVSACSVSAPVYQRASAGVCVLACSERVVMCQRAVYQCLCVRVQCAGVSVSACSVPASVCRCIVYCFCMSACSVPVSVCPCAVYQETFSNGKRLRMAAEVGLLTHNIKVIGEAYPRQAQQLFGGQHPRGQHQLRRPAVYR